MNRMNIKTKMVAHNFYFVYIDINHSSYERLTGKEVNEKDLTFFFFN